MRRGGEPIGYVRTTPTTRNCSSYGKTGDELNMDQLSHLEKVYVKNTVPSALQTFCDGYECSEIEWDNSYCGPTGHIHIPSIKMEDNAVVSGTDSYGRPFFAFKDIHCIKNNNGKVENAGVVVLFKQLNDPDNACWAFNTTNNKIIRDLGGDNIDASKMDKEFLEKLSKHIYSSSKQAITELEKQTEMKNEDDKEGVGTLNPYMEETVSERSFKSSQSQRINEPSEQPVKKKRGRPKKITGRPTDELVKKKRGRPKKTQKLSKYPPKVFTDDDYMSNHPDVDWEVFVPDSKGFGDRSILKEFKKLNYELNEMEDKDSLKKITLYKGKVTKVHPPNPQKKGFMTISFKDNFPNMVPSSSKYSPDEVFAYTEWAGKQTKINMLQFMDNEPSITGLWPWHE